MDPEIKPTKSFVAMKENEFLRQFKQPNDVTGYPVMAVPFLFWSNPVFGDPVLGV